MPHKLKIIPPPCLGCGKPLRRYRYRREALLQSAARERQTANNLQAAGRIGGLGRLHNAEDDEKLAERTDPNAQWGASGDNYFCKDGCAYKFAMAILRSYDLMSIDCARAIARAAYGAERVGGKLVKE